MNTFELNIMLGAFLGFTKETVGLMPTSWRDRPFMFDSDWNYLMKVVEKIRTLGFRINSFLSEDKIYLFIGNDDIDFSKNPTVVVNEKVSGNSNHTFSCYYKACVQFVQWYNQQK